MKGRCFKIGVAMASHQCVSETSSESRMGGVWGETAFKPTHTGSILKIIKNRGFEWFFLIYILHSCNCPLEKFCSLDSENKVNILEIVYELIRNT